MSVNEDVGPDKSRTLPRVLGPFEAICVIVGSVIGSGIFLVPARVAHEVPSIGGILLVWVIGGLFSAAGALTLAELGAMLPHAGGQYVYLREAYGRLPAFLFGWTEFLVIRTGSMATLAAAFARYAVGLMPARWYEGIDIEIVQMIVAASAMTILVLINVAGTKLGSGVQVVGTIVKVGALAAMMALPFLLGDANPANLSPAWSVPPLTGFMAAMVAVLWAYDGWVNLTPLAEEVHNPEKNIPRALILGMAILIAIYLGMTVMYHMVLPFEEIRSLADPANASKGAVAKVYCERLLGVNGAITISLAVMASTFISLNGNALTGPRAYYAMARDGLLPSHLQRLHPRFQTPANAILAQGVWAIALTVAGTALVVWQKSGKAPGADDPKPLYDILYTYVIFGGTIFYTLAIASVFVLRARRPDLPRPYRTWGYPFTPALYVLASVFLLGNMLTDTPSESLAGLGLVALGIPAYYYFSRRKPPRIGELPNVD